MARRLTAEEKAQRQARCVELRVKGLSYRMIGRELGINVSAAHRAVQVALQGYADREYRATSQLRTQEGAFLDFLLRLIVGDLAPVRHVRTRDGRRVITGAHDDGTVIYQTERVPHAERMAAFDRALRIHERKVRLFGLEAPVRIEAAVTSQAVGWEHPDGRIEQVTPETAMSRLLAAATTRENGATP